MALSLSIIDSCDVLLPAKYQSIDHDFLQARVLFYEYVAATARERWELVERVDRDLSQIAAQHDRLVRGSSYLSTSILEDDLDSRVNFAASRCKAEMPNIDERPNSRLDTPMGLYDGGQRYSSECPPQTEVKFPKAEQVAAGWLGDQLRIGEASDSSDSSESSEDSDNTTVRGASKFDGTSHSDDTFDSTDATNSDRTSDSKNPS